MLIQELALRAITSPVLGSADLLPVVQERIIELFSARSYAAKLLLLTPTDKRVLYSPTIRRLALSAALALIQSSPESTSHLGSQTRAFVLSSLSPDSPHMDQEDNPTVLAALVVATGTNSALFPLVEPSSDLIPRCLIDILERVTRKEWNHVHYQYHGVECPWLTEKLLRRIGDEASRLDYPPYIFRARASRRQYADVCKR